MDIKHYPYRFVKKVTEPWDGPQGFMLFKELYSFKSPKSNQTYWVWIEVYKHHFYAVKFHLKAHRDSDKKYNVMTGLNEARDCNISVTYSLPLSMSERTKIVALI